MFLWPEDVIETQLSRLGGPFCLPRCGAAISGLVDGAADQALELAVSAVGIGAMCVWRFIEGNAFI